MTGIEPVTSSLPRKRSTPELHRRNLRAEDGIRTRDPQLGRLMLYQLSYFRGSGGSRIRTCEGFPNGFTVRPRWPLEYPPGVYKIPLENRVQNVSR